MDRSQMLIGLPNLKTVWMLLVASICLNVVQAAESWSYVESQNGSSRWPVVYPLCGGSRQSPIDLPGESPKYTTLLHPIYLFHANTVLPSKLKFKLVTDDHNLKIIVPPKTFFFSLKNLNQEEYTVYEIVFHWGSNNSDGSEHRLDGKPFAMESQLMGYKTAYNTKELAENRHDGIAGLSLLHEACDDATKQETAIGLMTGLEESVQNYHNDSRHREMDGFNLASLVSLVDRTSYYRYAGSLTAPPCTESVIWTVFKDTVPILQSQLQTFRTLRDVVGDREYLMANNYRPVVPLNSEDTVMPRKVYATINGARSSGRASYSAFVMLIVGYAVTQF